MVSKDLEAGFSNLNLPLLTQRKQIEDLCERGNMMDSVPSVAWRTYLAKAKGIRDRSRFLEQGSEFRSPIPHDEMYEVFTSADAGERDV